MFSNECVDICMYKYTHIHVCVSIYNYTYTYFRIKNTETKFKNPLLSGDLPSCSLLSWFINSLKDISLFWNLLVPVCDQMSQGTL